MEKDNSVDVVPTNILYITHYSGMYGANQSLCKLMLELRNKYDINPIVLLPNRGAICTYLDEHKIKYYIIHYYWWVNANKGVFQQLLNLRKQLLNRFKILQLVKTITNDNVQLVYSNSITINIGTFVSKAINIPHIWHIRESMESYAFKFSLGNFVSKRFLRNAADKYILISDYLIKFYSTMLPTDKVVKIYNGISIEENQLEKNTFLPGVLNVCVIGVLCEQKNQMDALRAILHLKNQGYLKLKLHLIGTAKGLYLAQIEDYISKNKLSEMVVLHGHQDNVHGLLNTMDLALMTSRDEAFGRVTVEYMLHSMPVIASRSGANEEIVKVGVNGELYTLYNYEELAEKIVGFLKAPKRLSDIGEQAMHYAQNNFSAEANAQYIYTLIEQVMNKN
jgi:L-malate glycosyltransferase